MRIRGLISLALVATVSMSGGAATAQSGDGAAQPSVPYRVTPVATGLAHPWSFVFLPGGDVLISERNGGLRIVRSGRLDPKPVAGVPAAYVEAQGGLLGLALHPDFADNRFVYLCMSVGTRNANASTIVRGRFDGQRLTDVRRIFTAKPWKRKAYHFGCRLLFGSDGKLYATIGDGFDHRDEAQRLDTHFGKIVRLNDDGSVPADNPFVGRAGALPEIYSYGHRNMQGLALQPDTGEIWMHEHGPRGGDEVNRVRAGANYGWPAITYGIDYSGAIISKETARPGMEQPVVYWVPSIAPSGMEFYTGDAFPQWRGDLFVGALAGRHLRRLELRDGRVVRQESLLVELRNRIRDVRTGPDGNLYVLTDESEGQLLRIAPAQGSGT